jgi:GT2 family glycosyltransferase
MSGPAKQLPTAVVTLASAARRQHVDNQLAVLGTTPVHRVVVWLDADVPTGLDAEAVFGVGPSRDGMRLAAARNAGADRAVQDGAELLVFLDADCIPGEGLVDAYSRASASRPDAVLCGPVTYLPPGVDARDPEALVRHRRPHAARPAPPPGELIVAHPAQYDLFWSLSFALTAARWRAGPRFDERYEGYGGEDTDFARQLRADSVPLVWVGGADAYHQHHPTSSPPVQHVADILRNGALFADRWGEWPMTGWLEGFEQLGLVRRESSGWIRIEG